VIGFGLDLPQQQQCAWFYHMEVWCAQTDIFSVHSRAFFSWAAWKHEHYCTCRHFFSPFTCVFPLAPCHDRT